MKTSSVDKDFDTCGRVLMVSELKGKDTDKRTNDIFAANVITSRDSELSGRHRLVLDIDYSARLIPSTTDGRFHLYLDGLTISDEQFAILLPILAECNIISSAYAAHSLRRGYSSVRLPWVKKDETDTSSDAQQRS